ncbi:hypothetical protein LCGC14_1795150 [marine sediment metagenome]|uniref:Uncharacterized protein n=1 Tax=marine sediment metagenome TaxID=412755 RepID=A0A0F9JQX4_9ZZZZ
MDTMKEIEALTSKGLVEEMRASTARIEYLKTITFVGSNLHDEQIRQRWIEVELMRRLEAPSVFHEIVQMSDEDLLGLILDQAVFLRSHQLERRLSVEYITDYAYREILRRMNDGWRPPW